MASFKKTKSTTNRFHNMHHSLLAGRTHPVNTSPTYAHPYNFKSKAACTAALLLSATAGGFGLALGDIAGDICPTSHH
jgi:hypothetical protein